MKNIYKVLAGGALLVPFIAAAAGNVADVLNNIKALITGTVFPLLLVVGALAFFWGIFQFFILGGADEKKRESGRQLIIYGLIGFVAILGLWALVNILASTLGISTSTAPLIIP